MPKNISIRFKQDPESQRFAGMMVAALRDNAPPEDDPQRCSGFEQAPETGVARRCTLPTGHDGRHRHAPYTPKED